MVDDEVSNLFEMLTEKKRRRKNRKRRKKEGGREGERRGREDQSLQSHLRLRVYPQCPAMPISS